jgi:hypothetical protein
MPIYNAETKQFETLPVTVKLEDNKCYGNYSFRYKLYAEESFFKSYDITFAYSKRPLPPFHVLDCTVVDNEAFSSYDEEAGKCVYKDAFDISCFIPSAHRLGLDVNVDYIRYTPYEENDALKKNKYLGQIEIIYLDLQSKEQKATLAVTYNAKLNRATGAFYLDSIQLINVNTPEQYIVVSCRDKFGPEKLVQTDIEAALQTFSRERESYTECKNWFKAHYIAACPEQEDDKYKLYDVEAVYDRANGIRRAFELKLRKDNRIVKFNIDIDALLPVDQHVYAVEDIVFLTLPYREYIRDSFSDVPSYLAELESLMALELVLKISEDKSIIVPILVSYQVETVDDLYHNEDAYILSAVTLTNIAGSIRADLKIEEAFTRF